MDGTGAEGADPTGSAENTATGTTTRTGSSGEPARPAGPADATGPLPVRPPADATGPLPAGALFVDPTADRQASVGPETTGMPLVPDATGGGGVFDVFATDPPAASGDPAGPPTTGMPTTGWTAHPPADLFADPHGPYAPAETTGPQDFDVFATDPPAAAPPPAPSGEAAADLFTPGSAGPATADLFTPGPTQTDAPGGAYGADLFAAGTPHTATSGGPETADLFASGPPAANTAETPSSMFTPAVAPADATGPMPLVIPPAEAPAVATPEPAVPQATGALPPTPSVQARPGASEAVPEESAAETTVESAPGAWSFAPGPGEGDAWSFTGSERSSRRAQPPPATAASRSPVAPPSAGRSRRRAAWALTVVGVLVAVAAGIALTMSLARSEPGELITAAATDAGGWNGVRYQGAVVAADGGRIRFDLTVTVDGATGTLSRDGGQATAEIHRDASGTVLRANRTWWLYHHPTRADDLANTWVADPLTETQEVEPILQLHPYALAGHVRPEGQQAQWTVVEEQQVNGENGLVLSDGTRRVVVAAAAPHGLLAVDIGPAGGLAPVQVADIGGEEAAAVGRAAGEVREAEAPKTLTQRLLERPLVEITLEPEPLCVTPSCTVAVTVTNSGAIAAQGRLEVSADGKLVATHPLDVQPGQVATFTATAPNPQFATPGATGQILWESRAIDD